MKRKKICNFFPDVKMKQVFGQILCYEYSNLLLVPCREVSKEFCCLYLADIFGAKLISLNL